MKTLGVTLAQLEKLNEVAIKSAGPRYTPGIDPTAPNIAIGYLADAFDALSLADGWRDRIHGLAQTISKIYEHQTYGLDEIFSGRRVTPLRLVEHVQELRKLQEPATIRKSALQLRRNCRQVPERLRLKVDSLLERLRALSDDPTSREQRSRLQSEIRALDNMVDSFQKLLEYLDGPPGQILCGANSLLLLGSWGTGKTHLLCDVARQRLQNGSPALLVMASSLPSDIILLDGIAASTGLAASGVELLALLNSLGETSNTRALLMLDAINEGDREAWRQQLSALARTVSNYAHVGLVVSCRRPFNDTIVTDQAAKQLVSIEHYGFQDQEFDAQLEYFSFYGLPSPSIPLITPEFTRPLFLKILCEAIKGLGRRSQKCKLREIASGQKGMTYVLEYFTDKIGKGIEADLGLAPGSCWQALKGGLASKMANQGSDWLSTDDAVASLEASLSLAKPVAEDVLRRFVHDGLLAEEVRRKDSSIVTGIQFSYQRFGDHLIARQLLETHLVGTTEKALRRCFYRNRPLGSPFRLDKSGQQFEAPGIAAAIMLEFPERMKRSLLSHELLHYLPRATRRIAPIKDIFLDGLYWRSADAFTADTDLIVSFLLTQVDDWTRNDTFEVLVGLATRPTHPYSAERLAGYLIQQTMSARDRTWSEYLRLSDEQSNPQRILAWVERSTEQDEEVVRNEVRLLSLFLTTTSRPFRDRATRALVLRASARPEVLFDEVLRSLTFNDPYVPERMLASAYGVAMRLWADPKGQALREAIVPFARSLIREMFVPGAPHGTKHVLRRDYALGVISLARRIYPKAIARGQSSLLRHPFAHIPTPFIEADQIDEADVEDSRRAMHMDFANYTIGQLIPDRENYNDSHPEYRDVRRQIARRMSDLGYSAATFSELDSSIARTQLISRAADGGKIDRYGKKYSWIAFFEMYGVRSDLELLEERRLKERPSDCDVDPSFPAPPVEFLPALPDFFTGAPTSHGDWLVQGPVPNYRHLLVFPRIDAVEGGPWVLLNGFIQQSGSNDRESFAFIRGLLMRPRDVDRVSEAISKLNFFGNSRIPEPANDYYTYAGEIPWSLYCSGDFRLASGRARRHVLPMLGRTSGGRRVAAGHVEVPVHRWTWESYHSTLNQTSDVEFPAAALCEKLELTNHSNTFDLWDRTGHQASVYREFDVADRFGRSSLLYLRQDLLERYLTLTNQVLVWIPWGERTLNYKLLNHRPLPHTIEGPIQDHENTFGELLNYPLPDKNAGPALVV